MKKSVLAVLVIGLSVVSTGCAMKPTDAEHRHGGHHSAHHQQAGIDQAYYGNYEARFDGSKEFGAKIHIEDSGVYVNGSEVRAEDHGNKLTFSIGYAKYTLMKSSRWGNWHDDDAGNKGTIVPVRG